MFSKTFGKIGGSNQTTIHCGRCEGVNTVSLLPEIVGRFWETIVRSIGFQKIRYPNDERIIQLFDAIEVLMPAKDCHKAHRTEPIPSSWIGNCAFPRAYHGCQELPKLPSGLYL